MLILTFARSEPLQRAVEILHHTRLELERRDSRRRADDKDRRDARGQRGAGDRPRHNRREILCVALARCRNFLCMSRYHARS
jgi:hypothetical protein